jgi:hypothetical protein
MLHASDDLGTPYRDDNGGGFDQWGGPAAHGLRDLGGVIPPAARLLTIDFRPPETWSGWMPTAPYVGRLVVDLVAGFGGGGGVVWERGGRVCRLRRRDVNRRWSALGTG